MRFILHVILCFKKLKLNGNDKPIVKESFSKQKKEEIAVDKDAIKIEKNKEESVPEKADQNGKFNKRTFNKWWKSIEKCARNVLGSLSIRFGIHKNVANFK